MSGIITNTQGEYHKTNYLYRTGVNLGGGNNSRLQANNPSKFDVRSNGGSLYIAFWTQNTGSNHAARLFDMGDSNNYQYTLAKADNGPRYFTFGLYDNNGNSSFISSSLDPFSNNVWYFIECIYDGSTGDQTITVTPEDNTDITYIDSQNLNLTLQDVSSSPRFWLARRTDNSATYTGDYDSYIHYVGSSSGLPTMDQRKNIFNGGNGITAEQFQILFSGTSFYNGIIDFWNFNETDYGLNINDDRYGDINNERFVGVNSPRSTNGYVTNKEKINFSPEDFWVYFEGSRIRDPNDDVCTVGSIAYKIPDKSGNGRNIIQSDSTKRVEIILRDYNKALDFDSYQGTDDKAYYIDATQTDINNLMQNDFFICVVGWFGGSDGDNEKWVSIYQDDSNQFRFGFNTNSDSNIRYAVNGNIENRTYDNGVGAGGFHVSSCIVRTNNTFEFWTDDYREENATFVQNGDPDHSQWNTNEPLYVGYYERDPSTIGGQFVTLVISQDLSIFTDTRRYLIEKYIK